MPLYIMIEEMILINEINIKDQSKFGFLNEKWHLHKFYFQQAKMSYFRRVCRLSSRYKFYVDIQKFGSHDQFFCLINF